MNYIQYIVKGKEARIINEQIVLSVNKNSKAESFELKKDEIIKKFSTINSNEDISSFINEYGYILKEDKGNVTIFNEEVSAYRSGLKIIDILKNEKNIDIVLEKIRELNFQSIDNKLRRYMNKIGKIEEYQQETYFKDEEYKALDAIKELKSIINSNKCFIKDEIIFIGHIGISIYEVWNDLYSILNSIMASVLSNITLKLDYSGMEQMKFIQGYKVNTLLEAIYLYTYNTLTKDSPIRNCHNIQCNNPIISTNAKKLFCSDQCRSKYNKNKNSKDEIEKLTNAYKQRLYRKYEKGEIAEEYQLKGYERINKIKKELIEKKVEEKSRFQKEYHKIIKEIEQESKI